MHRGDTIQSQKFRSYFMKEIVLIGEQASMACQLKTKTLASRSKSNSVSEQAGRQAGRQVGMDVVPSKSKRVGFT